jgi:hypothetical protein
MACDLRQGRGGKREAHLNAPDELAQIVEGERGMDAKASMGRLDHSLPAPGIGSSTLPSLNLGGKDSAQHGLNRSAASQVNYLCEAQADGF